MLVCDWCMSPDDVARVVVSVVSDNKQPANRGEVATADLCRHCLNPLENMVQRAVMDAKSVYTAEAARIREYEINERIKRSQGQTVLPL